jgi:uncharacterized protein
MQFEQAGDFIISKLRKEIPANLIYHNIEHTCDVYLATEIIAKQENISDNDLALLLTAALYHDSGFLVKAEGHEEESCRIAKEHLPLFGYTTTEIEAICGMIMATRLPQLPLTSLEKILADADLDYLGRDDFFKVGHRLFSEMELAGALEDEVEWNKLQVEFMEKHSYFTQSAINLRQAKKEANIEQIKKLLSKLNPK